MYIEYKKGMEVAYSLISQANNDMISLWLRHTFLTWQWWFGLSLSHCSMDFMPNIRKERE